MFNTWSESESDESAYRLRFFRVFDVDCDANCEAEREDEAEADDEADDDWDAGCGRGRLALLPLISICEGSRV